MSNELSQRAIEQQQQEEKKNSAFSLYFADSTVRELLRKAFLIDE